QAFATALRQAEAAPPPPSAPLQQLTARIAQLNARMQSYGKRIAQLSQQASDNDPISDEVAILKAQQALDQDELQDAQEDLSRQGGDRHAFVERALQQHETIEHQAPPQPKMVGGDT